MEHRRGDKTGNERVSERRPPAGVARRRKLGWPGALVALGLASSLWAAGEVQWRETEQLLQPPKGSERVVAEFHFENTGTEPLRFAAVRPSCDCVSAAPDKASYAPGEAGVVRAEFTVAGREGLQEKTIAVTTSEGTARPITLTLRIALPEPIALRPRFLFWRAGEPATSKDIEVVFAEPEQARVLELTGAEPAFRAKLMPDERAGHYRVSITPASTKKIAQATIRLNARIDGIPRVIVLYAAVK